MRGLLDQREGWRRSSPWLRHLAVFPGLLSEVSVGLLVSSLALGEKALSTLIERHGKAITGLSLSQGTQLALQEKGEKQSKEELHRSHSHRDFCREGSPHNPHYKAKRKE